MNTYIVLLRGINVGGKNLVPMKELKSLLESNGFDNVRTYIQSGNIVLEANSEPQGDIAKLISAEFGFSPEIIALRDSEFKQCASNNPYQGHEGKFVHLYFCQNKPTLDATKLEKFIGPTEAYACVDEVFYLLAPDGIGRSKLVANIESCLGVSATGRNLNTINKLLSMLGD